MLKPEGGGTSYLTQLQEGISIIPNSSSESWVWSRCLKCYHLVLFLINALKSLSHLGLVPDGRGCDQMQVHRIRE